MLLPDDWHNRTYTDCSSGALVEVKDFLSLAPYQYRIFKY